MAGRGAPLGNKNGSKNRPITDLMRRALLQGDAKKARAIADALIAKAAEGDVPAFREVADRIEGKVPQPITGPEGGPLQVQDVPWLKERNIARR